MAKSLIFLLLLIATFPTYGQEGKWLLSLEAGLGAGWWVYDKGLTDTLPQIHRGYDRTHLSFLIDQSISLSYSGKNFLLGIQAGLNRLDDPTVVGSDNRRGGFNKYELTLGEDDFVPLTHLAGKFGISLFNKDHFRLTPVLVLGTAWAQAFHPEVVSFNRRFYQAGELQFSIKIFQASRLLLYPRFTNLMLRDSRVRFQQAKHNVYGIGLHTGLEIAF